MVSVRMRDTDSGWLNRWVENKSERILLSFSAECAVDMAVKDVAEEDGFCNEQRTIASGKPT